MLLMPIMHNAYMHIYIYIYNVHFLHTLIHLIRISAHLVQPPDNTYMPLCPKVPVVDVVLQISPDVTPEELQSPCLIMHWHVRCQSYLLDADGNKNSYPQT